MSSITGIQSQALILDPATGLDLLIVSFDHTGALFETLKRSRKNNEMIE